MRSFTGVPEAELGVSTVHIGALHLTPVTTATSESHGRRRDDYLRRSTHQFRIPLPSGPMNHPVQKHTLYVGGLAEEVNESILHSAFVPFGEIKDVKTPLDLATQKHRSFGFVTFLEKEDASAAMDNMDGAELYGRVLTVNYALPEKIKGGEQGWAAQPIWADADTWFERQQMEEEMQRLQAEQKAALLDAEELHRKKMAEEREGEKEEETEPKTDPMAIAEAQAIKADL